MLENCLFLSSPAPGQVFQYLTRQYGTALSASLLLLSDAVGPGLPRVLFFSETALRLETDFVWSLGTALSLVFPPCVTLLWRQTPQADSVQWGYTIWDKGQITESANYCYPIPAKLSLLSRLPGMKRRAALSPDIAWALSRGLPIDRVPAAGLRRNIPIIDYNTVAQLDQRNLLVETSPRLYRFTL